MPKNLRSQSLRAMRLLLVPAISTALLLGCASKPLATSADCPQPAPIPASLAKPSSPDALDYSQKVQAWLERVQTFLSESQQTKTPL